MFRFGLGSLLLLAVTHCSRAVEPEFFEVFRSESEGYKSIRIPSIILAPDGTLLAFAEGRQAERDQANNKLVLKKSLDSGRTWSALKTIADGGDRSLNNPCCVVEAKTGTLFLIYQSYPAGQAEYSAKLGAGFEGDNVVRNFLIQSQDSGKTWSKPVDVTRQTKRTDNVLTMASGPGIGIQLRHGQHAGRLLFPFNDRVGMLWSIYAVYSDDLGKTWQCGEIAPEGIKTDAQGKKLSLVNEAQFAELSDGSIRFNVRRVGGTGLRKTSVSSDGGKNWSAVKDVPEQKDPTCNASIIRYTDPADGKKSRLLFCGPQSKKRENGKMFLSYDEGKTWPVQKVLTKDFFAYAVLVGLSDGSIGCLYEAENYKRMMFARFTLQWLTDNKDHFDGQ
ncbi:exo-alpha-sialidase [Telmatocola sphagniphila]|uniref:exo-alpha-sialidase n=1 Tax=Telmatocola sphagniphila TaxID=1123043 RepID=A0A8E6B0Y5_9BACT|nr:sialidase family protein [Telmatocola sphagniphila]QVL29850.1 exo-alpha-sialidase [Telmatocola sphagniphila]